MKWLVQVLDNLTTNRLDEEAIEEQKKLEQLITRYKNLIPTIEITMTKTDIFTKSYTYRKEVREVCTLLTKVKEQLAVETAPEVPIKLKDAVNQQETRLSQLEQQRANIVSMLQRGKDLLKDQHAPRFVSSEIQHLESSWNDTYGQSIESLKTLKSSQKLWDIYYDQKEELTRIIRNANEELEKVKMPSFYNANKVTLDLIAKKELSTKLKKESTELMKRLRETLDKLDQVVPPEIKLTIREEITTIEHILETTIETIEKRVLYLEENGARWAKFQSEMSELKQWAQQSAPQVIANVQDASTSPEERVKKTDHLQKQMSEKMTVLKVLKEESKQLIKGKKNLISNNLLFLFFKFIYLNFFFFIKQTKTTVKMQNN